MKNRKIAPFLFALSSISPLSLMAKDYTNFVIILMDDMGYGDLHANGAIGYEMPNLDKMVNEGMNCTRYYAPQAVSGASRAGLLTGCYPNRLHMIGAPFPNSNTGISDKEQTLAQILKQKNYRCAAYGKWHLGDKQQFLPTHHGFDEYYGIPYSNDMYRHHPSIKFPPLPLIEGDKVIEHSPDQTKFTTDFTNRAVKFIHKNKKHPFFVYLAHPMPHVPLAVSDKFKGKSKQGLYGDVMMEIDWSVGKILETLKKEGLDDNTLVIVTSDNGPWLNYGNHAGTTGGLREGKGVSYEGGQRVPCVMRWPGKIKAGSVCSKLMTGIDILPTIATIAKVPMPKLKIDGVNMLPLLMDPTIESPRKSFCYYYSTNSLEAITDGEFKLVFPHRHRTYEGFEPGRDGKPGKVMNRLLDHKQLFDLRRDPGERYDIIDYYPERLKKLEVLAEEMRHELGDDLTKKEGVGRRPIGRVKK